MEARDGVGGELPEYSTDVYTTETIDFERHDKNGSHFDVDTPIPFSRLCAIRGRLSICRISNIGQESFIFSTRLGVALAIPCQDPQSGLTRP